MFKRIALFISISLSLTCCNFYDSDKTFSSFEVPVINKAADEYNIKGKQLTIWNVNKSDVPYVDLIDFLNAFNGFFDVDNITYDTDYKSGLINLYYRDSNEITFDWKNNTISTNDYHTFGKYSFSTGGTNYDEHLYYKNDYYYRTGSFEINLGDYYFDIFYYKNKCILPLFFANILFCSTSLFNVFYNGDKCFATYGETTNLDEYYDCSSNNKTQSKEMRLAAVNSLLFTFNNFYGLKEYKGFSKGFKNYISDETYDLLWSTGSLDNYAGYKRIIYKFLDELHTRIDMPSYYCDPTKAYVSTDDQSEFRSNYNYIKVIQRDLRYATIEDPNNVRYEDDLAIITLDSFQTGNRSQIYYDDGSVKENAWRYDTYHYMQRCMSDIKSHTGINRIVLDLSLNGGGNIGAMRRTLGFITDDKIQSCSYNTLSNEYCIDGYYVDVDGDGNYSSDAYDEYDWYLLIGINTFSAANLMTSIFKQMKLGKIIGRRSGGGMCSVMPLVLADGTAISISSPNSFRYVVEENNKKTFYGIEDGIKPDIDFKYENFYNDSALMNAINESSN